MNSRLSCCSWGQQLQFCDGQAQRWGDTLAELIAWQRYMLGMPCLTIGYRVECGALTVARSGNSGTSRATSCYSFVAQDKQRNATEHLDLNNMHLTLATFTIQYALHGISFDARRRNCDV